MEARHNFIRLAEKLCSRKNKSKPAMELVVTVLTTIFTFILGLTFLVKNRLSGTHVYLGSLIIFLALYPTANYFALNSNSQELLNFWTKVVMFTAIPVGPLFFSFVAVFPRHKFIYSRQIIVLFAIWMMVNLILNFSGLIFSQVSLSNGQLALAPGPGIGFFGLLQIGGIIGGIFILARKYHKSKKLLRRQLFFISIGFSASFFLMLLATIILPIVFNYSGLVAISPIFIALGSAMVATTVARHQFLNIKPSLARTVSFVLLIMLFGLIYSAAWMFITSVIFGDPFRLSSLISTMVMTLFVSLTFQPLLNRLRVMTDKFFFVGYYDKDVLLYELSVAMASTLLIEDLCRQLLVTLNTGLKVSKSTLILLNGDKIVSVYYENYHKRPEIDERKLVEIIQQNDLLSVDDLPPGPTRTFLDEREIAVLIPLARENKIVGAVMLGEKKSGDRFYETDYNVLRIFASQAVVAVENANAYEEIQRFNITLKEEVERATDKLRSANRRLLELDKLKDEFVSLASHELRTPMVSIRNYIWMVLNGKGGKVNPKQREYLRRAYDSTSRLSRLVNSMLNLSRIESGRVILTVEQADIRSVIRDVITEIGIRADKMGIKLVLRQKVESVKTGEPVQLPAVLIDIDKIKEVLVNLIGNSLKFTPSGGSITVALAVDNEQVLVSITDTGVGLEEDQMPKLFKKFSMLRESYSTNATMAQGTGLGLYISKSIIELHRGKIWVESKGRGKGSTFFFTIPRYSEEHLQLLSKNQHNRTDAGIIHSAVTDY